MSQDITFIEGLVVEAIVGIYDWERQVRQRVSLDVEMGCDIRAAARTENIELAINYKSVADEVAAFIGEQQFLLIETMAEQVADLIIRKFGVPWVRLKLRKHGAVPAAGSVGISVERHADAEQQGQAGG